MEGETIALPYRGDRIYGEYLFSIHWERAIQTLDFDDYEPDPVFFAKAAATDKLNYLSQAIRAKSQFFPIAVTSNNGCRSNKPLRIIDGRHRTIAFFSNRLDVVFSYHGVLSERILLMLEMYGVRKIQSNRPT